MPGSWTQSFLVRSDETDLDGTLSIPALCNYCQEAAGFHARETGISIGDLGRQRLTWVLGRLELEVDRLPSWRDRVRVTTWPSRVRSFFVVRDYLVEDDASDRAFARATSTWFVMDQLTRRAVRVPQVVCDVARPERARAMEESSAKLPRPSEAHHERRFSIRRSDLDANVHVNHVKYLEWALDTLDLAFFESRRLDRLTIDYLAELTHGDSATTVAEVRPGSEGSTTVLFGISTGAGAEAARMSSVWRTIR